MLQAPESLRILRTIAIRKRGLLFAPIVAAELHHFILFHSILCFADFHLAPALKRQIVKLFSINNFLHFLFYRCNQVIFNTLNCSFQISTKIFAYFPICKFTHINVLESISFTSMSQRVFSYSISIACGRHEVQNNTFHYFISSNCFGCHNSLLQSVFRQIP